MTTTDSRPLLSNPQDWPETLDVLVMGSGVAALTAAVYSAQQGATVAVAEKAHQLGGTTAVGGGVMWAPTNHLMAQRDFTDTVEDAKEYISAATQGRMSDEEIEWYIKTSAAAVKFLDEHTRVNYKALARPDYHREWPGSTPGGRGLDHQPFDPSVLEGLADAVRPASYFPLITMDERDQLHGAAPDPALLQERAEQGVRTMGSSLIMALTASAWDAGVHLAVNSPVTKLTQPEDADSVWTVEINGDDAGGSAKKIVQARNVIIASGGFEWSKNLTSSLLKFPITPISAPSNTGDGLQLGLKAGAGLAESTDIWGVPVLTDQGETYDGHPVGRMGNVEATLPGSVVVNAQGKRFVNEALNYHDFSRVFGNIDPGTDKFANIPAYLVMDSRYVANYPVAGNPAFSTADEAPEWMIQAETLESLATQLGLDDQATAQLKETIGSFNGHARAGEDPEFGRGSTEQDRHLGDPSHKPNPCLGPVETPPFYAAELKPGVLGTAGGLNVNLNGQIVDFSGATIPGLYAAGNCSATVFKDAYPGGGATIGSAITRAFAVGMAVSDSLK